MISKTRQRALSSLVVVALMLSANERIGRRETALE
jgi:hypothetical protein